MKTHRLNIFLTFLIASFTVSSAFAADIIVKVPGTIGVKSAQAKPLRMKLLAPGTVEGSTVRFTQLLPGVAYDVILTLNDGTVLHGINMGWHDMEPAKPDAGDMTEDDKKEIAAVLKQVLSFFNKNDIVLLNGNHDRATALVKLVRDNGFHSNKGDEVICRMELWYYKNQHGGWEKVQQAAEVISRDRYPTRAEYEKAISKIKWVPELGGLIVQKDGPDMVVNVAE